MTDQSLNARQTTMMVAMFIIASAIVVSIGMQARRDSWIAILLAIAASMVLVLINARLMSYYPDKDFFETMETLLGRPFTMILLVLMTIFLFQHYAYVLRHFVGFINVVGLPEVPRLVPLICMGLLSVLGVYFGIEILGRWTEIFLLITVAFILIMALLLTKYMDVDQLRPVMENGLAPVLKGTWAAMSLPFAQTVAFLFVLPPFGNKKSPYLVFSIGLLIGGALLFISSITNVLVLGNDAVVRLYFPTYSVLSIIQLGQFIQRLEIFAATFFTIAVFLKSAILLMAVVKSLGRIFRIDGHRFLLMPVMLMAVNYAFISFPGICIQYEYIFTLWPYYSAIFQIAIPVLLLIIMEYRFARRREMTGQGLAIGS